MSRFHSDSLRRVVRVAFVIASIVSCEFEAFARPGGGRGPGGPGGPGNADRPGVGGGMRPGPGGPGGPGAVGPGAAGPGAIGPGAIGPGPAGVGRPASPRDVETFINARPAAARAAVDPAAAQSRVNSLQASLAGRTQPFTAAWYAEHPNAWRYAHPYADWWAVAGVAGLSSWLGYSVATEGATTAAATSAAASTTATPASSAAPPEDLEWLPLGVFATAPKGATQAHVYQQLAVSRKGELKGNYYDAISNATQPISGKIDAETRKATWTVGASGGATFETTLDALVKIPSGVTMKTGSAVQEWELVQMENPEPKPTGP